MMDSKTDTGQPSAGNEDVNPSAPDLELVGTQSNVADREDVPPDGGYGWVCSVSLLFINAHTWGVNSVRELSASHRVSLLDLS